MVDAREGLLCQVPLHQVPEESPAFVEALQQEVPVVGELHLVEGHQRHGGGVEPPLELFRGVEFVRAELVVAVQNANLDHDLKDKCYQQKVINF